MHGPQQHRGAADGNGRVALAKYREEITEGAEQQHEVADIAQPGADPVPPGRRKPHVIAEPGLGVGVDPGIQFGLAIGQRLEHEGQGQHADGGDRPTDQDRSDIGPGRHVLRQGKDPATNHRTHHQRDQRAQAKLLRRLRHACVSIFPDKAGR
ncbi:hypothetical protein D3C73_877350 [compost metagenome]